MDLMQDKEGKMEAVSTSHRSEQETAVSQKRVDVISLGVAFVKEIREKNLASEEVKGILRLVEKLLRKENLLK